MCSLICEQGSQVLFGRVWKLYYTLGVLSVCVQEQFGVDVVGGLGSLLMCNCVSIS